MLSALSGTQGPAHRCIAPPPKPDQAPGRDLCSWRPGGDLGPVRPRSSPSPLPSAIPTPRPAVRHRSGASQLAPDAHVQLPEPNVAVDRSGLHDYTQYRARVDGWGDAVRHGRRRAGVGAVPGAVACGRSSGRLVPHPSGRLALRGCSEPVGSMPGAPPPSRRSSRPPPTI